jgi:thiol-disulfide isomerase/thioredoxin
MKKIFTSLLAMLIAMVTFGQMTFPYEENFDTFLANAKFVDQVSNTTEWTTWSNAPASSEDPIVSDAHANSGANSIKISTSNDLILLTGDQTDGRYVFKFKMYIPDGTLAYYNMLQSFSGSDSKWAYQVMFDGGEATVQGSYEDYFDYESDKWFELKTIVDLDVDWCEIYKDGELVFEFQWSIGATATNLKQMSAVNFYGWDNSGAGTAEYYFDDMYFNTISSPEAPTNLQATLANGNDVSLSWDAPVTLTPDSYSIYRNGMKIADGISDITFTDENVYPQNYTYTVRAFYADLGLSSPISTELAVNGGVARKTVLFEIGTGTWCTYCPGAARGVDQLVEEGKNVSVIEYHYDDDYQVDDGIDRIGYYGFDGFPTAVVNGTTSIVGGSVAGTMYDSYLSAYTNAVDVPAVIDMDMAIQMTSETAGKIIIDATETFKYFESGLKLRFAVTESHIATSWLGMTEVNFVCRDMLVGSAGLDVDFSTQDTQSFEVNFELASPIVLENVNIVAFIQHDETKAIAQAVNMDIPNSIGDITTLTFNVDMTGLIDAGSFVAGTDVVYVTGDFSDWAEPGAYGSTLLADDDSDKIYSATIEMEQNYGEVQYKYFKNTGWNGGEWAGEPNRLVNVADVPVVVNDVWNNDVNEELFGALSIYPNPFDANIMLSNADNVAHVMVQNSLGQVVFSLSNSLSTLTIPTDNLKEGLYFITIADKQGNTMTKKMIK